MEQEAIIAAGILIIVEGLKDMGMPSKYARIVSVCIGGAVGAFIFTDQFPVNLLKGVVTGATTTVAYGGIKAIGKKEAVVNEANVEPIETVSDYTEDQLKG